jgi:hypothetical protein
VELVKRQSMAFAVLLGVAIGLGLLAKQAMIYAALCIGCHAVVSHEARNALKGGRGIVVALIALALFAPNVVWNAEHGFPTVKHTEANIGWQYPYVHRCYSNISACSSSFTILLSCSRARPGVRSGARLTGQLLLLFSPPVLGLRRAGVAFRARQLVGDRLSCRPDPRHRGHARAQPARPIQDFTGLHLASRHAVISCLCPAMAPVRELQFLPASSAGAAWPRVCCGGTLWLTSSTRGDGRRAVYYLATPIPLYVYCRDRPDHYEMTRFHRSVPRPILFVSRGAARQISKSFGVSLILECSA